MNSLCQGFKALALRSKFAVSCSRLTLQPYNFNFVTNRTLMTNSLTHQLSVKSYKSNLVYNSVRNNSTRRRHKKYIKLAKGYRGRTNCFKMAFHRVIKARQYTYRDRKVISEKYVYLFLKSSRWSIYGHFHH